MRRLGISVYPEHENIEETYAYLKLAGSLGFNRVFTCLLSVKESKEEIIDTFSAFCNKAHESGLTVSVDTNPEVFKKLGATPFDLSVFKQIGVDIIRLDGHFGEMEDIEITKNKENIMIEYNSSCTMSLDLMLKMGANKANMCICSNFYPQRYTGMGLERFKELQEFYKPLGLNSAAFVTSNAKNTHGPWPVYDGLPTLEIHRDLSIDEQLRHLVALGYNDDFFVGNAFADREELEAMSKVNLNKITMKVDTVDDLSPIEKEIITSYCHANRDDCNEFLVRSSLPRVIYKGKEIKPRENKTDYFHKGDVLIVNDNLEHYRGELLIVTKDIKALDHYNLVGHLNEAEQLILDCIKPRYSFTLEVR